MPREISTWTFMSQLRPERTDLGAEHWQAGTSVSAAVLTGLPAWFVRAKFSSIAVHFEGPKIGSHVI